jgi:rRNA maturation endonuclease Nob1
MPDVHPTDYKKQCHKCQAVFDIQEPACPVCQYGLFSVVTDRQTIQDTEETGEPPLPHKPR